MGSSYGFLEGLPFWGVYLSLFCIVFARTQLIYWAGRGIGAGVHRSRIAARLGDRLTRAERLINRFGAPAVTLSFATVGLQTAVNLAAGVMRMGYIRYLVALFFGSLIWATLYSLGGVAAITAWWSLFLSSPLLAVAVAVLLGAAVILLVWRRRSARGAEPGDDNDDSERSQQPLGT
ncbi:DedA family protein [Salinactinospora qingdaonensis]|uniref:VTT domain-containing protein n=1 Tax=Salinactinospora qingdaonensis TaxID=702744 RepID=A0ABP7GJC9_9ACTN